MSEVQPAGITLETSLLGRSHSYTLDTHAKDIIKKIVLNESTV